MLFAHIMVKEGVGGMCRERVFIDKVNPGTYLLE